MPCLDDRAIHAWTSGALPEPDREVIRTHLDDCESCRELVASALEGQWIGQTAGRYRLIELIGAGAMGEVYRAEDPELDRSIAIKIVHPGGSQDRLLREARVMAQLAHPNIIRIYDVGMLGERVFLAMELIAGATLRRWLGEARDPGAILATVRQAGAGLAAAHAAGLVHGDFKPDNVLVADDGRVVVTDFGLARIATDEAAPVLPRAGRLAEASLLGAGTPAYMAPEQLAAASPATAASDQFAFCVTLYEALYGQRPFVGADVSTLRTAHATRLAVPPRAGVPRRLARVVRRGLAPVADQRYPTMAALLAELDRATSRRTLLIAAGAALGGGAIAAALLLRASGGPACAAGEDQLAGVWDDAARARLEQAFQVDLPYAKTSLASVVRELDRYAGAWAARYTETCEATHVRGTQSEALLDLRMHCLQRRAHALDAVVGQLVTGDKAVLRDAVAAVNALPSVEACADVASLQELQALPADPEIRRRAEALELDNARCGSLLAAGRYRDATPCAAAVAGRGGELHHAPAVAEAELTVGQAALRLRDWAAADAAFTRALLAAETSRDARTRARVLIGMISVAGERATFDQGHARADHAAALVEGLDGDRELAAELAMATGVLALREGKFEAAIATLGTCVALREQLHGKDDARVAEPLVPMAIAYTSRGKFDDAKRLLDRALTIEQRTRGDTHPAVGKLLHALAQVQARMGQTDAALATQQRSLALLRAAYGDAHADVAQSISLEAQIDLLGGRYAAAAAPARRAAELMERVAGPDHPDTAVALVTLAAVLNRAGDVDGALAVHQRALAIRMKTLGPEHLHTTQSQVNTAMALRSKHRCDEALPLLEAARAVRIKQLHADHPDVLRTEQSIADCHVDLGHADRAVPLLEHAVAVYERGPRRSADDKVTFAQASYGLARALWDVTPAVAANRDRALQLARRAHADLTALGDKRAAAIAEWATKRRLSL